MVSSQRENHFGCHARLRLFAAAGAPDDAHNLRRSHRLDLYGVCGRADVLHHHALVSDQLGRDGCPAARHLLVLLQESHGTPAEMMSHAWTGCINCRAIFVHIQYNGNN